MGEATTQPKPKLRWYQYRLAHLFIFVTICAIPCSWFACRVARAKRQQAVVKAIEDLGGLVRYDYERHDTHQDGWDDNLESYVDPDFWKITEPPGPVWLRNLVGVDFLADVVTVKLRQDLSSREGARPVVTDDWIQEHIARLTKLEVLWLTNAQITDAGLVHLQGLTKLEELDLNRAHVTDEGVKKLQRALPGCSIYH